MYIYSLNPLMLSLLAATLNVRRSLIPFSLMEIGWRSSVVKTFYTDAYSAPPSALMLRFKLSLPCLQSTFATEHIQITSLHKNANMEIERDTCNIRHATAEDRAVVIHSFIFSLFLFHYDEGEDNDIKVGNNRSPDVDVHIARFS